MILWWLFEYLPIPTMTRVGSLGVVHCRLDQRFTRITNLKFMEDRTSHADLMSRNLL